MESVDSTSGLSAQDTPARGRSNSTRSAGESSKSTGPLQPASPTSETLEQGTLFPSISSAEDSPARTSPTPDDVEVSKEKIADSGLSSEESSTNSSHNGSSLRTPRTDEGIGCAVCGQTCESVVITPFPSAYRPHKLGAIMNAAGVSFLPTPVADDVHWRRKPYKQGGRALSLMLGGPVNPEYAEWMMGFPVGWTDLEQSETPSSRKSRSGSGS